MLPGAQVRVVRGAVRIIVIAPLVVAFPIPLIVLFSSILPLYLGLFGGAIVLASGVVEVVRGVLENRADQRALPEARIIE